MPHLLLISPPVRLKVCAVVVLIWRPVSPAVILPSDIEKLAAPWFKTPIPAVVSLSAVTVPSLIVKVPLFRTPTALLVPVAEMVLPELLRLRVPAD